MGFVGLGTHVRESGPFDGLRAGCGFPWLISMVGDKRTFVRVSVCGG